MKDHLDLKGQDAAAIFLASSAAGYAIGVNLAADGGYICM